ncbi:hypothetical protein [Salaquimonas pukyongi]|uniref:hypothetical protein n=1 Tax=Salaquimonas pukyongi TaxID=2712698 RepID=UPI0012EBCDA5|nr:hypothetical protein [Salaquimonas pukyongi]
MEKTFAGYPALSETERKEVFLIALAGFQKRNAGCITRGMTDPELAELIASHLGIFGGSCGPERMSVIYQGSGLKIWGGRHVVNHCIERPLFQGGATIATAREVFEIGDPENAQLKLL